VGRVKVYTSGDDVARLALPSAHWDVVARSPYMIRVHDVPGAFAAHEWPVDGEAAFAVAGDHLGTANGVWHLAIDQGKAACMPATDAGDAPVLTPGGLALAWAGAQTCANLRMAGHLTGGRPEGDAALDRLFVPRPVHIRDYF
jgi:hypothetical protein